MTRALIARPSSVVFRALADPDLQDRELLFRQLLASMGIAAEEQLAGAGELVAGFDKLATTAPPS